MLRFVDAVRAWGTPEFDAVLKREIEELDAGLLPLQQGLTRGSHVGAAGREVMLLNLTEIAGALRVKVGVFYTGVIAGCSCADDPSPVEEEPEYCELQFEIDMATAQATVVLVVEPGGNGR